MVVASHASCPPTAFQSDAHNNIEASVLGIRTSLCVLLSLKFAVAQLYECSFTALSVTCFLTCGLMACCQFAGCARFRQVYFYQFCVHIASRISFQSLAVRP